MNVKASFCELPVQTPDGEFVAGYSEQGLAYLNFPKGICLAASSSGGTGSTPSPISFGDSSNPANQRVRSPSCPPNAPAVPRQIEQWHRTTTQALRLALVGVAPDKLPPLDLSAGTTFQQAVWNALRRISLGQTRSYGEIARAIGRPKAVRAAGGACGANPIPIFIPCHRVLAANRKLGGFSGGPGWKKTLLAREGVSLV